MKRIRVFCLLALTVMCLTAMVGCGRQDNNGGTGTGDTQNGTDQTGDNTGNTGVIGETQWCTCEPGDHGYNDNTENGTGGVLDDIGNGITDAVDDLGNAAGDVVDDLTGHGSTEHGTNGGDTTENGTNRMR